MALIWVQAVVDFSSPLTGEWAAGEIDEIDDSNAAPLLTAGYLVPYTGPLPPSDGAHIAGYYIQVDVELNKRLEKVRNLSDLASAAAALTNLGLPPAATIVVTSDGRLSDDRTPVLHASSHAAGGGDELTVTAIGAASVAHTHVGAGVLTVSPGKNLFDQYATYGADTYWDTAASPITLATYEASALIPVTEGVTYAVTNCRTVNYRDVSGNYVTRVNNATMVPMTFTVPAGLGITQVGLNVKTVSKASCQLELGSSYTTYEPYGYVISRLLAPGSGAFMDTQITALNTSSAALTTTSTALVRAPGLTVYRATDELLIRSAFDATNDIVMPLDLSGGTQDQVKFATSTNGYVSTVPATATDASVWPTVTGADAMKGESDDNCPFLSWGGHVGANHGWAAVFEINIVGHDKAAADLGSVWTDGTRTYTLIKIVSASAVQVAGHYTTVSGMIYGVTTTPAATLTHVSGATHTSDISIASGVTDTQLFPSTYAHTATVLLDGRTIPDGRSYGDVLTVVESYSIVSYKSFIDWSRANPGSDPLANLASMTEWAHADNTYRVTAGGQTIIGQKIRAVEKIAVGVGVTQAIALSIAGGEVREQFMPGVGTAGGQDWSTWVDISAAGADANITAAECDDPTKPGSWMVQTLKTGAGVYKYGFAMGYLPYGGSAASERLTNAASLLWQVRGSSRKNYPQVSSDDDLVLLPGEISEGTAFRKYLPPAGMPVIHFIIDDGNCQWAYVAHVATTTGAQMAAPTLLGRKLTAIDPTVITAPARVQADGVRYEVAAMPGYGQWRAEVGQ